MAAKSFAPTPGELALVNQIFAKCDPQKLGILTGDVAVSVFSGSKLSPTVLGEVWQIADAENQGFLTRKSTAIALRLIGHAQKGEAVSEALINKPGPLPNIEGYASPPAAALPVARPMSPQFTGLPVLTPQDKAKFARIFASCGPTNGLLSGEKSRDVFLKSKLPVDKLSQIWSLADTQSRGSLDLVDFSVGMYLIQACMSGTLPFVPTSLPPGLYEQAGGSARPESVVSHPTGGSNSGFGSPGVGGAFPGRSVSGLQPQHTGSAATPLQAQYTGSGPRSGPPLPYRPPPQNVASALGSSAFGTAPAQVAPTHWDVTPAEKANADRFFDTLDSQKRGFLDGDTAVPFMLQSNLPEDALAQVWDLADVHKDGRLTRDGFAVAMHLIQNRLAGKDLPAVLPPTLVPPSMRGGPGAAAQHAHPQSQGDLHDLIWDDAPAPAQPALQPQATGTVSPRPAVPPAIPPRHAPVAPVASPAAPVPGPSADPFGAGSFPGPATLDKDLLGDDSDDEPPKPAATAPAPAQTSSPPVEDKSADIGNVRNQISSTNRSVETAKAERTEVEERVNRQAAELSALQTQLATAKAAYDAENKVLAGLRERYAAQSVELNAVRSELITAESELSAIKVEKAEVEGTLLREKEEVRELQRQMKEVGMEIEMIKLEVEKAKKEAKQQKGLLAIAKKQLATRETERTKVEKERDEAQEELAEAEKDTHAVEATLEAMNVAPPVLPAASPLPPTNALPAETESLLNAATHPLPLSPDVTGASATPSMSPPGRTGSNNPFDRLAAAGSPQRSHSPFAPFASATLPTHTSSIGPHDAASTNEQEDPFGLGQPFTTEPAAVPNANAPVPYPTVQTSAPEQEKPLSVDVAASPQSPTGTDLFSTPPSTAHAGEFTPSKRDTTSPAEKAAQAAMRSITTPPPPGGFPADEDFNGPVQEKEVEESDSDEETDDVPLASLAGKGKQRATPGAQLAFDDAFGEATPQNGTPRAASPSHAPAPASAGPTANGFDDVFGTSSTPVAPPSVPPPTNGVNDFDEAMGKLSGSQSTADNTTSAFSFDTAFDDNFDFGSASESAAPNAAPTHETKKSDGGFDSAFGITPAANGTIKPTVTASPFGTSQPQPPSQSLSFDDTFPLPHVAHAQTNGGADHGVSFDDVFGEGANPPTNHNQDATASSKDAPSSATSSQFQPPPGPPPGSLPNSPLRESSMSVSTARSQTPPRSGSPPPRHASPRPRVSTASSRESTHDKDKKEKNSRLSIRLPFGRKKNKQEHPPPMPTILTPPTEERDPANTTPAADDDLDVVKQLCSMGFSRQQAVTALEANGYDMQRSLNSLLGGQ